MSKRHYRKRKPKEKALNQIQLKILTEFLKGEDNKTIADRVFRTLKCVKWNFGKMFDHYGVNSRLQLAIKLLTDVPIWYCSKCGAVNEPNSDHCKLCGK